MRPVLLGIGIFSVFLMSSLNWANNNSSKKTGYPVKRQTQLPQSAGDERIKELLNNRELQGLGEKLFFDKTLSNPPGMACATCHDPKAGWGGADNAINLQGNIYPGAISTRFGNRKPTSAAYATFAPTLHTRREDGEMLFVGGNFWDGRATGYILGNPTADQAQQPFLNPVEHNLKSGSEVVLLVEKSVYANAFKKVCNQLGLDQTKDSQSQLQIKFGYVGLALAAFENSDQVNSFSSKYDAFMQGKARLSPAEQRGLKLFNGKGKCAECHPSAVGPKGELPLFTDFTYDNLGIPANPNNPWYRMEADINPAGVKWIDEGLGGFLKTQPPYAALAKNNLGKHRVPTLRNVDKRPNLHFVRRYGHNGYFPDLASIIHFYNTRDTKPSIKGIGGVDAKGRWPKPEVTENVNTEEMGDLKLNPKEEVDILAFLMILSDGYIKPKKSK